MRFNCIFLYIFINSGICNGRKGVEMFLDHEKFKQENWSIRLTRTLFKIQFNGFYLGEPA